MVKEEDKIKEYDNYVFDKEERRIKGKLTEEEIKQDNKFKIMSKRLSNIMDMAFTEEGLV